MGHYSKLNVVLEANIQVKIARWQIKTQHDESEDPRHKLKIISVIFRQIFPDFFFLSMTVINVEN